ncbi:hypothetical protein GGR51DRAFT_121062 [Nemania sp. FL0031]|nr:hypothetical protein GGR51DRAFT_121062 [Nemania sp. FL0031]
MDEKVSEIASTPLAENNSNMTPALLSTNPIETLNAQASHSPGRNKLKERGHYSSSSQPSDSNTEADEASPSISMRVVKEYVCPYSGCRYTARSRKDVRRHLGSEKHKHEQGAELPLINRDNFKCTASNCRSGAKGFSRRDNFMRHMAKVHGIQLDRLKPGRKREIETE